MLPFKLVYSDAYYLPIGEHVFPAEKYRRIHDRLLADGIAEANDFLDPEPASDQDILLVHKPDYVHKLKTGTLSPREEMELEVPFSPQLVRAFWLAAGGSILAARQALADGVSVNIGGGFHHAFSDHGEGFCMIHDVAVAIRRLQRDDKIRTAMTVDCDVHHGNGTAAIFRKDPSVFTISIHQENNYPALKPPSTIDLHMMDRADDDEYLDALIPAVKKALEEFRPELLFYVGGADPFCEDQLGGLSLTKKGLMERDRRVFAEARQRGIPVATALAGGYARRVEDTVRIHVNTILAARVLAGEFPLKAARGG
jgi:acetoin utilization deacetylase AcuC-like enzyme